MKVGNWLCQFQAAQPPKNQRYTPTSIYGPQSYDPSTISVGTSSDEAFTNCAAFASAPAASSNAVYPGGPMEPTRSGYISSVMSQQAPLQNLAENGAGFLLAGVLQGPMFKAAGGLVGVAFSRLTTGTEGLLYASGGAQVAGIPEEMVGACTRVNINAESTLGLLPSVSAPRTAVAEAEGFIGPTIGRSGCSSWQEFGDAALNRYQGFYDQADAIVQRQVAAGNIANDPLMVGRVADARARYMFRQWLRSEGMVYDGPGAAVNVNRRLYDPLGSGAYRIPDVRIPGAKLSLDGTLATSPPKTAATPQIRDLRTFSGGHNVIIVQPTRLGGSYGVYFP